MAAALLLTAAVAGAEPPPVDPGTSQLREALALARSDSFHLVLDLPRSELRLMLGGVALRTCSYAEAAVGTPRLRIAPGTPAADWSHRVWRGGSLDPRPRRERPEIVPPGRDGAAKDRPAPIPPSATELPPPPSPFRVRFEGGLDLEIRTDAGSGRGLGDRLRALADPRGNRVRVRLTLTPADASTLYRSLPPDIPLVVLGQPR